MLTNLKKKTNGFLGMSSKDNKGFTIIEVMIVLVIAAVILLIVFLAVPALQRNSRNTQRKSDIARILTAAREYQTNTNSWPPDGNAIANISGKFSMYTASEILPQTDGPTPATGVSGGLAFVEAAGFQVVVYQRAVCSGSGSAMTAAAGNKVLALYNIEASNGSKAPVCTEG